MDSNNNIYQEFQQHNIFGNWIPKKVVQNFFNYGNTKMSTFASDYHIRTSKVGKRIFYNYSDILRLIEECVINSNV